MFMVNVIFGDICTGPQLKPPELDITIRMLLQCAWSITIVGYYTMLWAALCDMVA